MRQYVVYFLGEISTNRRRIVSTKVFPEALICDVLMVKSLLGVNPTQSYGENTKSSFQDFIDFAMKNPLKIEKKFSKFVSLFQFKIIKIKQ